MEPADTTEPTYASSLVDALKTVVLDTSWQRVGVASDLRTKKCRKIYAEDGEHLALIYVQARDTFYAMEAACSHEGGPLDMGDIEDVGNGSWVVVCPWHHFEFDVATGENSYGLSQKTFPVKIEDGFVYVNSPEMLSLTPFPVVSNCHGDDQPTDPRVKAKLLVQQMRQNHGGQSDAKATLVVDGDGVVSDATSTKEPNTSATSHSTISIPNDITADVANKGLSSLEEFAIQILKTADPEEKVRLTFLTSEAWLEGSIDLIDVDKHASLTPPETPWRRDDLNVVKPEKIKRGKGGTLASRIALIHSLANIEQWAIDLSWDVIARFTNFSTPSLACLPRAFYSDFIKVAVDEAKHFKLLETRLRDLGSHFGALPVHNALWQSAHDTKDSFLARLAIVHMVHEARGLDVHPKTRQRFAAQKDEDSVSMLEVIFQDEITHVEAGLKWFSFVCARHCPVLNPVETFHEMVKKYFQGYLKPPFNTEARETAGMTEEWYLPLVKRTDELVE